MMDPATAALGIGLIGTLGSTISGIRSANYGAEAAKAEAKSIGYQTQQAEFADRKRSREILSKQQAGAAAAGLDISSGSPLELMLDSAAEAERNALNIRYGGELKRYGKLTEAGSYKQQIPGLIFSGLGGAGSLLGKWYYRQGQTVPIIGGPGQEY